MPRRSSVPLAALLALLGVFAAATPGRAQSFHGVFRVPTDGGGSVTATLSQRGDVVTGTLTLDGAPNRLEGVVDGGVLVGTARSVEGVLHVEAQRFANELRLTLYGSDAQGRPDYGDAETVSLFVPGTAPPPGPAVPPTGGNPLAPGSGGNPLAGADPFVGTFTDGSITLRLEGFGGQYRGQLTVAGQLYPVTAIDGSSGLDGVVQAPDGAYGFSAQMYQGVLYLSSEGRRHQLYPLDAWNRGGYGAQPGYPPAGAPPERGARPPSAGPPTAPASPAAGPSMTSRHPLAVEWTQALAGQKLARVPGLRTGPDGYATRDDVHLCPGGDFVYRDARAAAADPGFPGRPGALAGARGLWAVVTDGVVAVLVLQTDAGPTLELVLEGGGDTILIDGRPVVVTPAALCG